MSLAKDIGHVGSAYLVEKNLGSLDGSQSDVATIASSLRSGNVTATLPAIKKISQNASLTLDQKPVDLHGGQTDARRVESQRRPQRRIEVSVRLRPLKRGLALQMQL
jgi:hypothetical protein